MDEQQTTSAPAPDNKAMKIGVVIVIVILLVGIAFAFWGGNDDENANDGTDVMINEPLSNDSESMEDSNEAIVTEESTVTSTTTIETPKVPAMEEGTTKSFTVKGSNFAFDVKEMKVKKGDTVKITFFNEAGVHDLLIDEFNVNTMMVPAGESKTVEFVADKTGSFEYYCSVGQHRQMGMKGNLIVE